MKAIPTACKKSELDRIRQYCEHEYKGEGVIVEFGPMLGGSTQAILESAPANARVITVDRFIWEGWMDYEGSGLEVGQSFLERFMENIGHDPRLTVVSQDLATLTFSVDEPVEFVFLDAAKSIEAFRGALLAVCSQLIPGGFFFDQDFKHALPVHMYQKVFYFQFRDFLTPVESHGDGVGFRVLKAIPRESVNAFLDGIWSMRDMRLISDTCSYFEKNVKW